MIIVWDKEQFHGQGRAALYGDMSVRFLHEQSFQAALRDTERYVKEEEERQR